MLKAADWIEVAGIRFLVVRVDDENAVLSVSKEGNIELFKLSQVEHLPDCTGWSWEKFEMRQGKYYQLANGDVVGPVEVKMSYQHTITPTQSYGYWWHPDGTSENPQLNIVREVQV